MLRATAVAAAAASPSPLVSRIIRVSALPAPLPLVHASAAPRPRPASTWSSSSSRLIQRPSPVMTIKSSSNPESDSRSAKVLNVSALDDADAKWIKLKAIEWVDPEGRNRKWEAADRTTRKGPVDGEFQKARCQCLRFGAAVAYFCVFLTAVAICAIIHKPSWSGPHVLLVSQFRPPCASSVIEMPAGLVDAEDSKAGEDENKGIVRAAVRELREETGYGEHQDGTKMDVVETSTVMMNDPGLTGANMKLCLIHIQVADDAPDPVAEPEEGEHIERHLVPLKGLYSSLKDFQSQGYNVDARLAHFAIGLEVASGGLGIPSSSSSSL
ncbi:hypothetical protein V8E36_001317 [Tilletia maclaganii]